MDTTTIVLICLTLGVIGGGLGFIYYKGEDKASPALGGIAVVVLLAANIVFWTTMYLHKSGQLM